MAEGGLQSNFLVGIKVGIEIEEGKLWFNGKFKVVGLIREELR